MDALEDSLAVMDDHDQQQQPRSQPQQQQRQQPPQKAKSAPRKRPAKRQRKRPAPQPQQQPDDASDEEALLASWRELVSTSAKSIGRSPANVQRYLIEAEFQVEILSPAAVSEILTLVNSVATNPVARDRVQALIATGLHNPALRNPVKLQIRHTLSRAALNAVLQAL